MFLTVYLRTYTRADTYIHVYIYTHTESVKLQARVGLLSSPSSTAKAHGFGPVVGFKTCHDFLLYQELQVLASMSCGLHGHHIGGCQS